MNEALSALWQAVATLIGLAVFLGLMWWIIRANAFWWRRLAERYAGRSPSRPLTRKVPETIVITGRPKSGAPAGYRQYAAATIALHDTGLSFDQVPPFDVHCPPLFLPFDEMELSETDWMLWPDAYVIRMDQCPDLDLIVAKRVVNWVRQHIDVPPFGSGV